MFFGFLLSPQTSGTVVELFIVLIFKNALFAYFLSGQTSFIYLANFHVYLMEKLDRER